MPGPWMARKGLRLVGKRLWTAPQRLRDLRHPTWLDSYVGAPAAVIDRHPLPLEPLLKDAVRIAALGDLYLGHRFDLLGSGWVPVRHAMTCAGMEGVRYPAGDAPRPQSRDRWLEPHINRANLAESARIWGLLTPAYVPIDWQLDFKSGYRWSERTWYLDIGYGRHHGADIKLPWELARMQHLVQFAWCYALSQNSTHGFHRPDRYVREFRDQILDFIATNPPRFGVNWACTMDVAIRAANWVVAYGLLRAQGVRFDREFDLLLGRSLYEHGRHIMSNLEAEPDRRTNHYLSDLAGLAFVAASLDGIGQSGHWLRFAREELIGEVGHQFNREGSNFEASTSYHRLAAEMVVYATALFVGLPDERGRAIGPRDANGPQAPPFPRWYLERLARMASFTRDLTKPDGCIVQVGDNDNGRFLKAAPAYELAGRGAWCERQLDHRHLPAAIGALFAQCGAELASPDGLLVRCLAAGTAAGAGIALEGSHRAAAIGTAQDWQRFNREAQAARYHIGSRLEFAGDDLREGLELCGYPQFGIYVFRSRRLFMAVRCGSIGQDGHGGHAHNDQLSIELTVDGDNVVADPGTYVYTAAPAMRNRYRSVRAHFAPRVEGREPAALTQGLFRLGGDPHGECRFFGPAGFVGCHHGYGWTIHRLIAIEAQAIRIVDYTRSRRGRRLVVPGVSEYRQYVSELGFSPGYGGRLRGRAQPERECAEV